MTKTEIDELVSRYDSLSPEEKKKLAEAIVSNEETREIAANGAFANGHTNLGISLALGTEIQITD